MTISPSSSKGPEPEIPYLNLNATREKRPCDDEVEKGAEKVERAAKRVRFDLPFVEKPDEMESQLKKLSIDHS